MDLIGQPFDSLGNASVPPFPIVIMINVGVCDRVNFKSTHMGKSGWVGN